MDALTMANELVRNGYSISLIAKNANMQYMDLYRSLKQDRPLRDEEKAAIKRFAIVQPCMER